MTCAACGHDVPPGSRFCPACGAPRGRACTACGADLTSEARFCAACGAPVRAGEPAPVAPVAERRLTSVLFGDLVGFTTLSEARDPEEVRELLSGYFERCRTVIARYGGTVEKFIGDAVMAVWGVPATHEDDAERAVRAGLDLLETVAAFGIASGTPGLAMRVGVVTGEVAVTIGATAEGMVAGDAVNTAARVQGRARPGTVWIDEQTRRLTNAAVASTPTGPHLLKGKADPVDLHEVVAVMGQVGDTRRVERVEAPLIGNRGELALLKDTFHAAADDGRARLLVVSGQPGVGKTRLGWELEKYIDGLSRRVRWDWGRCLGYGTGVAFSALSAAVRGRVDVADGDTPDGITDKIDAMLADVGCDAERRAWLVPRVALLLDADRPDFAREDLFSGWVGYFEALAAGGDPVVWVVDDAHHADEALLDFVEHLVAVAQVPLLVVLLARPELLENRPHLATSRRGVLLTLEELSPLAMAGLVDRLVPGLPTDVVEALARRAEGVPLYAIEAVRSMLDQGLLVDDAGTRRLAPDADPQQLLAVSAPASLRVLVSSRLDSLPATDRALLGAAAVLGTSFTPDALATLAQLPIETVAVRLAPLVRRDMLHVVTDRLSAERGQYVFAQTLVRQVAYETQSRRDRAERHLAAARYLQTLDDSSAQLTMIIARHLGDALDLLPATDPRRDALGAELTRWLESAADRARAVGAMAEALASWDAVLTRIDDPLHAARIRLAAATTANVAARFEQAVGYTETLPAADLPADLQAESLAQRSKALRNTGRVEQARDALTPWQHRDGLSSSAASVVTREFAACLHQLGRLTDAGPVAERAQRLAEDSGRADLLVLAMNVLGNGFSYGGLPRLAASVYRGAADLARAHHLLAELNMVLANLAAVQLNQDPAAGIPAAWEAIDLATQVGDTYSVVNMACNVAEMLRGIGEWDRTLELFDLPLVAEAVAGGVMEVQTLAINAGLIALARGLEPPQLDLHGDPDGIEALLLPMHDAIAQAAQGDPAGAYSTIRPSVLANYATHGLTVNFALTWTPCVDWAIAAGRLADARELIALVASAGPGETSPLLRADVARLRATVDALDPATRDGVSVEAGLIAALDALELVGYRPDAARVRGVLADQLERGGRAEDAAALRAEAWQVLDELGATAWIDAAGLREPAVRAAG